MLTELPLRQMERFDTTSVVFPIRWTLGDFVRKLREERGWNQDQLAEHAHLNKSAIVRLEGESDKSERKTIRNVAQALGVSVAELEAHVEHASLFAELLEVERQHVVNLEKRLLAKRRHGSNPGPSEEQPADPPDQDHESGELTQTRQRK